ncbi:MULTISPECIES: lysine--tRNA ligase [Kitasatospora]|uniref:Lysine--tRNA ligase n=1 Tax=Kitasatospora setae (strain ATCC 33774 / DSM 43861 / JCM 3304 / KCC A-0304 / NBRC 14216 / KM-6054) TaxID=452652 RepID=E4N3Y3_KITSK|nr:lysine--tRNA ligase [Kitasatospora setae]BAJ31614.1 putative lysyl-tRNA synthetase [Kitasatospora setae KM-6054]
MAGGTKQGDWVVAAADQVLAENEHRAPGAPLVCASGISPSGPVHLGNLREVMVPHFVADELRRRGLDCRHILSWDDFDRLRKVPAGAPESFAQYIGRPLTSVPDPCGEHENWAEHYKVPFRAALAELGVEVTEISQTEMYRSGAYTEQILHAMRNRDRIDAILGRYRTAKAAAPEGEEPEDSVADDTDEPTAAGYYPYKPYCAACGRDLTTVTAYSDETAELSYTCQCGHRDTDVIGRTGSGKLVWKVDWPMRWAYEGVTFEAGGVDHSSPGSSFTVGSQLVREVFDARPPAYLGYSFVGVRGMAKMSGSAGGAPTPGDALRILEAPLVRWLYVRRRPNQSFTIAFDQEVARIYDEWDAAGRRLADGGGDPLEQASRARALGTATATLPITPLPVPFRVLASVVDITTGDEQQILRILGDMTPDEHLTDLDRVRPRLDRAEAWVTEHLPAADRTHVRTTPDRALIAELTDSERDALDLLLKGLDDHWSLDGLTTLLYGVPKLQAGLPLDTPATPELKAAQRALFARLYQLLVGTDTGPRLPTLLLALGAERIRTLLTA